MGLRLIEKDFPTYGARVPWGKALAVFLGLAMPVCAQEVTVLALGDSLTQGYGLPVDKGFVPQLQDWLNEHGAEVSLVNGGVSGDTSAGGAARVDWSLTPEIDAMIVAIGANDMLRGIAPEVTRENLDAILAAAAAEEVPVLLVGQKAPGNYGPDYKAAFDAIFPDLAQARDVRLAPDFFVGLADEDRADWPEYLQPDGLHPNARGVARLVEGLGPAVLELVAAADNAR